MCILYETSLEVGFHMMFQKVFNVRCPSISYFSFLYPSSFNQDQHRHVGSCTNQPFLFSLALTA